MVPRLFLVLVVFHLGITAYGKQTMKATLKSLHAISDIRYRYATTLVSLKYYNTYNFAVTADLHVNMPRHSFISNFSMEIDGNVTVGEVKQKSEAKRIYDHAIKTGQSAGYVAVEHRFTNVFDISVNVEPQKYIVYNLTYQELLTRENNKYRHVIHLSNGGIIDDFLIEVFIKEPQDIINVSVPEIKDDKARDFLETNGLEYVSVDYVNSKEVYIKYNPNRKQQEEISKENGIVGLFKVAYDVNRANNSNFIYAVDGYFVHFFTADFLKPLRKHIIFILDVSGSMSGTKILQLKEAMENILDQLDPELDKFIIGKFSSDVVWMENNFLPARKEYIKRAKTYIRNISASGGTNIDAALLESIVKHKSTDERVLSTKIKNIIIFLTDGHPTVGVSSTEMIKKNVREANEEISLFTLGFGEDYDHKFLREIAAENGGFTRKIYVDSDSSLQIENLYKEISNILLKDITFVYLDGAVNTSTSTFSNYFKGSELVVSGILRDKTQLTMHLNVNKTDNTGRSADTLKVGINLSGIGDDFTLFDDLPENPELTSIQSLSKITEKTYAYLTLKQLLKEERTHHVKSEILDLALKYNFVTPLTAMVVTKSKIKEKRFDENDNDSSGVRRKITLTGATNPFRFNYFRPSQVRPSHVRPSHGLNGMRPHDIPFDSSRSNHGMRVLPALGKPATTGKPTTTGKPLPIFPHAPAIALKPLNCKLDLCFTDNSLCRNQTRIMFLNDKYASK
ncbi:inter alpha-trypsin inhibitor, heavy chain 4 isoform X2 [Octopus bimaculoides]|uniref:inter alpha-trypsin inhibitor, heavy chain 4 isoform X2 n=1 Tax=Octopus bimaculoides TaxID=37653 RepID=UPI0022E15B3A|nr:inter alpha-trypsin inhibitor, heavy chain 4 isoform X2 [Octopus bimaculoides]